MAKYTTDQIILQFKKRHGDKFDYSRVEYTHAQIKVKIICRIHGEFEQLVGMHRRGQGCAKCMHDGKRHTKEQVVKKFIKIHGSRYDYSLMEYINTDTKINIICHDHGLFEQSPDKHIAGNGCPKCIGRHKTLEDVLLEFKNVHGEKYDYSQLNFIMITKKVKIICPEHGVFLQTPQNHISGKGCGKCAGTEKLTQLEVINSFKNTHGERYDYSLVEYKNSKSKIKIICTEHGIFEQDVFSHRKGADCPKCAGVSSYSQEEIIKLFKSVHGNKYDYSNVVYKGIFPKVNIICKKHGSFKQSAKKHKEGRGCPECAETIGYTKKSYVEYCEKFEGKTHLYLVRCFEKNEEFFKIGISRKGALMRFDSKKKLPYNFEILEEIYGDANLIWDLEKSLHKLLTKHKYIPKLDFHGKTECFKDIPSHIFRMIKKFNNDPQLQLLT